MKIGELFVQLGFKTDDTKLKDFVRALGELDMSSVLAVTKLGAVYHQLRKLSEQAVGTARALNSFSIQTGLSARSLQQWQKIAEQVGATADDITSSVRNLQSNSASLRLGGGGYLNPLGIDPHQDPFVILDQLRGKIKQLDPAIARNIISQMGLSDAMLNVLYASDKVYDSIKKQGGLDNEQIARLMRLGEVWTSIKQKVVLFADMFTSYIAPALTHLGMFISDVAKLGSQFESLKRIILTVGVALGIAFAPIATIVLGLILLIDDFYTYLEGGESRLRPLWDFMMALFEGIRYGIEEVTKWVHNLTSALEPLMNILDKLPFLAGGPASLAAGAARIPQGVAAGASGGSNQNNNLSFNIATANPMSIVHQIEDVVKRVLSDTAYQDPRNAT